MLEVARTTEAEVADVCEAFRDRLAAAREATRAAFVRLLDDLAAIGVEAIWAHNMTITDFAVGDMVIVNESFHRTPSGRVVHTLDAYPAVPDGNLHTGPYAWNIGTGKEPSAALRIRRGPHTVIAKNGRDILVAPVGERSEFDHAKAVGRLRRLARGDGFRVQQRDREITLVDPITGAFAFVGDVVGAFAWILNFSLTAPTLGEPITGARSLS
jgi:hypothetical protein